MDLEKFRVTQEEFDRWRTPQRLTVCVVLTDYERADILPHCQQAMIGGRSDIFGDRATRMSELPENQLVGLPAEAAFFKWAEPLGSGGVRAWLQQRSLINANKWKGDGGVDCVLSSGTKVDVKASEPNGPLSEDAALRYHLTQCRAKTIDDVAYVQVLTKRHMDSYQVPKVFVLAGWLWGSELRGREDFGRMVGWSAVCRSIRRMDQLA
jgi:hypothetical protein